MLPAAWVEANPIKLLQTNVSLRRDGLIPALAKMASWALSLAGAVEVPATLPYTLSTSGADGVNVSLTLTNRGPLAGDQVVQAYLVPLEISAPEAP